MIRVRTAVADDWSAIWPIWHRVVGEGLTYTWDPSTGEAQARAIWFAPGVEVFVAEDDGRVVATAQLKANHGGPGDHVANAGFMVDPDASGRGIGRLLARHVLEHARERGFRAMQFNAVVQTNAAAVALWQSLGFSIVGTVPAAFRHPQHGEVGLHIMHRPL